MTFISRRILWYDSFLELILKHILIDFDNVQWKVKETVYPDIRTLLSFIIPETPRPSNASFLSDLTHSQNETNQLLRDQEIDLYTFSHNTLQKDHAISNK